MREHIQKLWCLQEEALRKKKLLKQKEELPYAEKIASLKERINKAEKQQQLAAKKLQQIKQNLHKAEMNIKLIEYDKNTLEQQLYENGHFHAKELLQMEKRLQDMKESILKEEDSTLVIMEKKEEIEQYADKLVIFIEQATIRCVKWQQKCEEQRKFIDDEVEILNKEINKIADQIPDDFLEDFKKLSANTEGKAIATLKGDFCGECGIQLPSYLVQCVKSSSQLQICNNCGRILYWKTESVAE